MNTGTTEKASNEKRVLGTYQGHDFVSRRLGNDEVFGWDLDGGFIELFRLRPDQSVISFFPHQRFSAGFSFKQQFKHVREIQVQSDLVPQNREVFTFDTPDGAPWLNLEVTGFGDFASLGLSVLRKFRGFFDAIDEQKITRVVRLVSDDQYEGLANQVFAVRVSRFNSWIKATKQTRERSSMVVSRINSVITNNTFHDLFELPKQEVTLGRLPMVGLMTKAVLNDERFDSQSTTETVALTHAMRRNSHVLAKREPEVVIELRETFELAAIDLLIHRFESLLHGSKCNHEREWQAYFKEFPLALQQLFACPQVIYGEQLHVRMPSVNGAGARVVDFMLLNPLTHAGVVVELKTPGASLLRKAYRGEGDAEVFPPHKDLVGAVAQLQAQLASAHSEFKQLLRQSRGAKPIETASLTGVVIVGSLEDLSFPQLESLHLYRRGLRDIEVVTFDEVLERLRSLRIVLSSTGVDPTAQQESG